MEINLNFVLFEELRQKADGPGAETRIVIIRESEDVDSALDSGAKDAHSLE